MSELNDMKIFRLGDQPSQRECDLLGCLRPKHAQGNHRDGEKYVAAIRTTAFRAPRKGEWYLSGALPMAYKAPNDLSQKFRIMRLVAVERKTKVIETVTKELWRLKHWRTPSA